MTTKDKVARRKLSLLELAKELDNVSRACKVMGYSREQFYEIRRNFQTDGAQGVLDRLPGPRGPHPNRVAAEVEEAILAHALEHPCHGALRVEQELRLQGIEVSAGGVRGVWQRHALLTKHERLLRLEKGTSERNIETDALASIDWIGPDESMTYPAYDRWLEQDGLVERCRIRVNSVYGMLSAARAGLGVSVLPCYLGENDGQLSRVGGVIPSMATDLWILTHPDLRKTERIRIFLDHVAGLAKTSQFGLVE